ncbi:sigma factor [Actinoplanes sp. NPDC048791]|uniref:RNA polymerase sigma factor n=1 Tax=Actinoplanes sp. NPDC048791 TaxID=3154623 RepID=UPI0033E2E387
MVEDVEAKLERRYRRWSKPLVGYVMAYTGGDLDAAEGIVDEAFQLLYRQWDRRSAYNDAGLFSWLRLVVRNRAVDEYRRHARIQLVVVDPLEDSDWFDQPWAEQESADPVYRLLAQERGELARDLVNRCMKVIHGLRAEWRIAILLRGEGLSSAATSTSRIRGRRHDQHG